MSPLSPLPVLLQQLMGNSPVAPPQPGNPSAALANSMAMRQSASDLDAAMNPPEPPLPPPQQPQQPRVSLGQQGPMPQQFTAGQGYNPGPSSGYTQPTPNPPM